MWTATRRSTMFTQRIFEAAHRPYIGIESFDGISHPRPTGVDMQINVWVRNSGSVPARNVVAIWGASLFSTEVARPISTGDSRSLLPGQSQSFNATFKFDDRYKAIGRPRIGNLEISVRIEYKGITSQTYQYEQLANYNPSDGFKMVSA